MTGQGRIAEKPGKLFSNWGRRGTVGATIPGALTLDSVTMRYGAVTALDNVSMAVEPGEVLCLLGHSGCGKTTLLRVAVGIENPTQGRVLIDGIEVSGPNRHVQPEERGIGLMFQDYALFPHLSVFENVMFGLRALSRADAEVVARAALSRVGMEGFAGSFPHMLSGGEQQRVALARAVAPRPGIILMDEPFSNLDQRLREEVREETLALMRETGATAIVVTHDPEEAMRIADRIVLMRRGRIVQSGTGETLYRAPADLFTARFFCDFNELQGVVKGGQVATPLGLFPAPGLGEGTTAIVCVRPESIRLAPAGFCMPGRVMSLRCIGMADILHLATPGLEKPVVARVRCAPGPIDMRPGSDVGIDIIRDEVLVFPGVDA